MVDLQELQGLEIALQNGDATAWLIGFLWGLMEELGRDLSSLISEVALPLIGPFVYLLLTWYALKMILLVGTVGEILREISKVVFFTMIAVGVLAQPDVIFSWVINPLLNAGANLAELIQWHTLSSKMKAAINSGAFSKSPGIEGNPIAEMMWLVDRQIDWVIYLSYKIVQSDTGVMYVLNYVPRLFAAAPLLFLSVGLLGLFCAYTAEALFNFLIGAVMIPLGVVGFVMPKGRAYAGAVFRILLAGALTIVLLSIAMGLTGRIVSVLEPALIGELTGQKATEIAGLQDDVVNACKNGQENQNCVDSKSALEKVQAADSINVFGPAYTLLIVMLILSIILHMKAKTIAGNLTGINDGPGPAATVVGLATASAGAVWAGSKWAAAKSSPAIAKGAESISRRMPFGGGGGGGDQGSNGGATSRRVPTGNDGTHSGTQNPPTPNSSSSGASGAGGPDLSQLNKNLENLIKKLDKK